jgi:PKD repeat protein
MVMTSRKYWIIYFALLILITVSLTFDSTQAQTSSEPELPRILIDTTYIAPTGNIFNVAAGGNFQAALNAANPGDVIVLQAGATFTGNFTLPNKTGSDWVIVRSSTDATLPAPGTRVQPLHSSAMAKLISPNAAPAIATLSGAHHYRFVGVEIGLASTVAINYGLVAFGDSYQNILSQVPHDLILDRCYVHGNTNGDLSRGVALNCANGAVIDSYVANIHGIGFDTQAIAGWNGPGPLKIVNNYLEAAGENVMFGGADPKISGLVVSDIEFKRNLLSKPLSWNPGESDYAGIHWSVKNIFELKNAQRVLIDGNLFEHNWMDAQNGTAILFTPRNQEGTAPWSVVQDVTFTNNIVRHTAAGINLLGRDYNYSSQPLQRVKIQNNLFVDVGNPRWGSNNVLFYLLDGTANVTIDHNTAFQSGNIISADGQQHTGFVYTNNLTPHNNYGIIGSGYGPGRATLNAYFPGYLFAKNILAGGSASAYPAGNYFPATLDAVGFIDRLAGNYHLSTTSLYRNAGTDGKDIGADMDAIEQAQSPPVNQSPVVTISASGVSGSFPLTVDFTSNASDADGQIVKYDWNFGDGGTAQSAVASHIYQTIGTYTAQLMVTDNAGATAIAYVTINVTKPAPPAPQPTASDIVLYAADSTVKMGNWSVVADITAAGGRRLSNPDFGIAKINTPLANPVHYFELSFQAPTAVPYRLWIRGKADNNSPYNDSFYVQFSDSVTINRTANFRIGTTDATVINLEEYLDYGLQDWGWQDNGWGINVLGALVQFQSTGTHTLRIQVREDGFSIDQIVLSPLNYLLMSPGRLKNDTRILPKNSGGLSRKYNY